MMLRLLSLLTLVMYLSGCYEPVEGCLDIAAVNFDATADQDCCCQYPEWRVLVSPRFAGQAWTPETPLANSAGQPFRLERFVFYLSEFTARDAGNGTLYRTADTVQVQRFSPGGLTPDVWTDDILLFRYPVFSYSLGSFAHAGTFDQVRVRFGLPDDVRTTDPRSVLTAHPLREQIDSLWWGEQQGYIFARMILAADTAAGTPLDTLHFRPADFATPVFITGTGTFVQALATNFETSILVQYDLLFNGVNFSVRDTTAWKQQIIANIPLAFGIVP